MAYIPPWHRLRHYNLNPYPFPYSATAPAEIWRPHSSNPSLTCGSQKSSLAVRSELFPQHHQERWNRATTRLARRRLVTYFFGEMLCIDQNEKLQEYVFFAPIHTFFPHYFLTLPTLPGTPSFSLLALTRTAATQCTIWLQPEKPQSSLTSFGSMQNPHQIHACILTHTAVFHE